MITKYKIKKTLRHSILITLLVALAFYLVFITVKGRLYANKQMCSKIEFSVSGESDEQYISYNEVCEILKKQNLYPIKKTNKLINTKAIEDLLSKHPLVKNVECYKTPKGNVKIDIEQRIPMFRVVGLTSYYIDTERKKMPTSNQYSAYVPVVTGNVTLEQMQGSMFDFIEYLRKQEFWNHQVVQINVDEKSEIQLIPRVGNHIIRFGKLERCDTKLKKLKAFYLNALNKIGWDKYSSIDVRFKNQVVCK